jgi:glycosyltransferase involved in cell wall biosynthesis
MTILTKLVKTLTARPPEEAAVTFPLIIKETPRESGDYAFWINNHRWNKRLEDWCRTRLSKLKYSPTVGILMQCNNPKAELLQETLSTIFNQVYPFSELSIVDRGSTDPNVAATLRAAERDPRVKISFQKGAERDIEAIARIMKKATAEWILLIGAEDVLQPYALYNMIASMQHTVDVDFVYSDSDMIDDHGLRFDPQFKPVWAVGARYPLGYYQHPVLLHDRLVKKLHGHERISLLMEEGTLLDEASNNSRWVVQAPGVLYHARKRGFKNETPPAPQANVLMNENLYEENGKVLINKIIRSRAEPKVPLKILWAIDSLDFDDGPIAWYHYVRYLSKESGHQFVVVSTKDGSMRPNYEKICSAHVASDQQQLGQTISDLHRKEPFDVAFVSSVENCWFPEVLEELQIPTLWQLYPNPNQELTAELKRRFQYPATILFLNASLAAKYQSIDSRGVSRILPTGVDLMDLKIFKQRNSPYDIRAQLEIEHSAAVYVIAGPTVPRKGQLTFVKAALQLRQQNPASAVEFFIVGTREGAYLQEITDLINSSEHAQRFHLIPEKNDPLAHYPFFLMADVCVSCSTEEVFPLHVLEAMSMKKPIIASRVFSVNEVVEHEENGYLTTPGDVSELAARMEEMLNKPDLRDFYGRRSLELIYEKFQFRKIATEVENLLRETIVYM